MWFILFVGSLITSMASGLYTPICADGGLPVCATNGVAYLYFENECRLNAYIYKQIYLGHRVPIKTDLENCLLNCHEIVCPVLFKPVCAQQVPDGAVRTVPNACLVNQLICSTKRHWKVIGEGLCAPTLKPLTDEEYSFTSPPSEDYLSSDPQPISTSYIASSPYIGQEYSSPPYSDSSSYAVQDQSENYSESAPYATPDKASVQPTHETAQAAPYSAAGSDPLPYTAPDQSQSYQAPSDSAPTDQSQSYQAPAPIPVPITAPYVPLDQNQNYVAPTVSVPVPAPAPHTYATAPDSEQATYVALDQSQKCVAPAEVPKSYSVLETIPSSAPYEVQPPSALDQSLNYVVPVAQDPDATQYEAQKSPMTPYSAIDQSPTYLAPAPAPLPYPVQEPVPAPAPALYSSLDQGQNYTGSEQTQSYDAPSPVPVAPYEAQQPSPTAYSSSAVGSAVDQSQSYEVKAPAACANGEVQQIVPYSNSPLNTDPEPYSAAEQPENDVAPASVSYASKYPDPAPTAAPDSYSVPDLTPTLYVSSVQAPAPYEAQQPAPYPYAASDSVPVTALQSSYEAQQPASVPAPTDLSYTDAEQCQSYPSTTPAPTSASYANTETAPAYQAQAPSTCSCMTSNQYSESKTPLLSNIYSRLPGSLDLTKLFKQLRRRFGMFVYQPRYTHIIISD